jgi:glycosyltransferase involved in cell wall biosynthesis
MTSRAFLPAEESSVDHPRTSWHVVQYGARDYYSIPKILEKHGKLGSFETDIWLPGTRRHSSDIPLHRVFAHNIASLADRRRSGEDQYAHWIRVGSGVAGRAARRLENLSPPAGLIGYTCGALEFLTLAARLGLPGVLCQVDPGLSWYETRAAELARWPGAEAAIAEPDERFVQRIRDEWRVASNIIVNSEHARSCLVAQGVQSAKTQVVPLSSRTVAAESPIIPPAADQPFRVLFVGSISVTKGFPYFGEAAKELGSGFEFIAAGANSLDAEFLSHQSWPVSFRGHVAWPELQALMRSCHALVFPTLSDGFGLVQLEAMSQGLPVISTGDCGAVVEDGISGFIIPAKNADAIADRLLRLRRDADLHRAMSANALLRSEDFALDRIAPIFLDALTRHAAITLAS